MIKHKKLLSPMRFKKILFTDLKKNILGVVSKQASKMAKEGEVGARNRFCHLWIAFLFVLGSPSFILNGKSILSVVHVCKQNTVSSCYLHKTCVGKYTYLIITLYMYISLSLSIRLSVNHSVQNWFLEFLFITV